MKQVNDRKTIHFVFAVDGKGPNRSKKEPKNNAESIDPSLKRSREIDLKLKHRDLNKDYQRLRSQMTPEEERGGFTDRRLISLWEDALEGNFTAGEMESIKVCMFGFFHSFWTVIELPITGYTLVVCIQLKAMSPITYDPHRSARGIYLLYGYVIVEGYF